MVLALDEQIREHLQPIIKHKRTQNSLLNVSRLPPEVLGYIFWLNPTPGKFHRGRLNFLFVCHYWCEVALHTPELWSSWGNTLQDWARYHLRHPETPLDLVLDETLPRGTPLCASVQNTLRDRAARGTIRLVHLRSEDVGLLNCILGTMTADQEVVRCSRVESLILQNEGDTPVDASTFFAHTRFLNLRHLDLTRCAIPHWDDLISQTKLLETLALHLTSRSSPPTAPQLLSLLASNPSLQKLALTGFSLPDDLDEGHFQVSLPLLRELKLAGECEEISMLLARMVYPDILDHLDISLDGCTVEDISDTIGPYLRDYFRRRGEFQNGLEVYTSFLRGMVFHVGDGGDRHFPALASKPMDPFLAIAIPTTEDPLGELFFSLMAHTPQEEIFHLRMHNTPTTPRGACAMMGSLYPQLPNLRVLYSKSIRFNIMFPGPGADGTDRYPSQSLRYVSLERVYTDGWTPLTDFLSFSRMSPSKRLDFLHVTSSFLMTPEVEAVVRRSVQEFRFTHLR